MHKGIYFQHILEFANLVNLVLAAKTLLFLFETVVLDC